MKTIIKNFNALKLVKKKKKSITRELLRRLFIQKLYYQFLPQIYCRLKLNSSVTGIVYHRPLV